MNEFIEKLKARLEDEMKGHLNLYCDGLIKAMSVAKELAEECKPIINYNTLLNDIKSQLKQFIADSNNIDYNRALVEAIEVIDKKAEEHNGDWIPCENELPPYPNPNPYFEGKNLELYLATVKGADYPFRVFWNGKIFTDGWGEQKVIAWQPLPKKYNQKGE